ncbi:MAG: hypothetical protein IH921_02515 [Gemmatimonadetes bacterium]|nr:hypothetical protein [Gemmatimonadota bacterium]
MGSRVRRNRAVRRPDVLALVPGLQVVPTAPGEATLEIDPFDEAVAEPAPPPPAPEPVPDDPDVTAL